MKVYGFVQQPSGNNNGPDALLLRALNGRLSKTDLSLFFAEVSRDGVEGFMLSRLLRLLVDAWINSGRTGVVECPLERQPWREPIQDYIERNPPKVHFMKDGSPFLVMLPPELHERKGISWFARNVEEGLTQLPDKRSRDAKFRKALHSAADPATALYLQMLDSPIAARLFRCEGCGIYSVRPRALRTLIKRGSYCATCKREGKDRARRMGDSRDERTRKIVRLAADAWQRWKPDRPHSERAEWVAQQVNERLKSNGDEDEIAKNWVTWHQDEIEAEVKRRSPNG